MAWLVRFVIRALEKASGSRSPEHLVLGKHGETEAFFYLQKMGYRIVATNFRVAHNRGEIDLIGWDKNVLCFIEVKTRTDASFAPPATAVTRNKQAHIVSVARRYVRRLPAKRSPACRFDVLSIVLGRDGRPPQFTLHKGAFSWDTGRRRWRSYRDFTDRHFWRRR